MEKLNPACRWAGSTFTRLAEFRGLPGLPEVAASTRLNLDRTVLKDWIAANPAGTPNPTNRADWWG
jgi:hypothetical protein